MRRVLVIASCFVLALGMVSAVKADLVSDFWAKVQSTGVQQGEAIRVVFVTAPIIRGDISEQAVYDDFALQSALAGELTNGLIIDNDLGQTGGWKSLVTAHDASGGTPVADWISQTGDPGVAEVKVFNTNGELVGTTATLSSLSAAIKYDGSGSNLEVLDVDGNLVSNTAVWTGTKASGAPASEGVVPLWMGNDYAFGSQQGMTGGFLQLDGQWLENAKVPFNAGFPVALPVYAMSGTISAVPEPSTIMLWLGFSSIAGLVYWRKRRN